MTVRILHAADVHLGRPFPYLGDAEAARQKDLIDTFGRICDTALDNEVAALLIAGDLFDTFDPPADLIGEVEAGFGRLAEAGVRVFVVPGEADGIWYERSVWRRPRFDGVHVFRSASFETESFEAGDATVHVHGIAFHRGSNREPLGSLRPDGSGIHIGLLHAAVDAADGRLYPAVSSDGLAASGLDYVALGHDHTRRQLSLSDVLACYPGSPEGLTTSETGPHFVALAELGSAAPAVSFPQVNRREVSTLHLDTTGCRTADVLQKLAALSGEDVLLSVHLTGTPDELLDTEALASALAETSFWIEIHDATSLVDAPFTLGLEGENSIRGQFVATLRRRIDGTRDDEERAALERALKLGLRSLRRSTAA